MTQQKYKIEIAFDACGGAEQEYADWLNDQGHDAWVGNSTATYIDGIRTASDCDAIEISNGLWDEYCSQ